MISYGPLHRTSEWLPITAVLGLAAVARLWFLSAGVPHAVGIDEPQVVDRALRILHTGSWNTHLFDYPTLVIYLQACVQIVRFLWGALNGEWASLDAFTTSAVYTTGRFVTAAIGVATVWLTWRLARDLASRRVALLAAAQLAVRSLHVRESHYILTDVPVTALTTLALWLSVRAARLRTTSAYACAGAACGLAAAAKYNGGVVLVALAADWVIGERTAPQRGRRAAAALAAAAAAFLIAAPYTVLDMPAFLDGFAAQFSRFAAPLRDGDAPWRIYVKHLTPLWSSWWVPAAVLGGGIALWRRQTQWTWAPLMLFMAAFYYVLSTHRPMFGRYALPLLPPLCILAALAIVELVAAVQRRVAGLARPAAARALWAVVSLLVLGAPTLETVRWLDGLKRVDTRTMAADWLKLNVPRGARLAVENSGPTYLDAAGFRVVGSQLLIGQPLAWYRQRVDWLVISSGDLSQYGDYLNAGPTVFQAEPTPQRWGPPIRIISLAPPVR
jgi:4-amino-4-deoxy-L-arabinose transferase-like glycosyltransferase